MSTVNRGLAMALVALVVAAPLAGQGPATVVSVLGGGYSPLVELGDAHFNRGFTLGGCVGVELTPMVALHADVTWMRSIAHGEVPFTGTEVSRLFYGAHVELRAPFERGLVPFAFVGAGAVRVEPRQAATGLVPAPSALALYYDPKATHTLDAGFTTPAATFGAGLFYLRLPGAPLELFFEGKALVFQWDAAGYNKTQVDVTYALGVSYRAVLR